MEEKEKVTSEDELDFYDCWKTILKRKRFVVGLFLTAVVLATVVSFLMPKIYRGEVILKITPVEFRTAKYIKTGEITSSGETTAVLSAIELINIIGKIDDEKIHMIFSKNPSLSVVSVKILEIKGSLDKMKVIIESEKAEDIQRSALELIEYINNTPLVKRIIEQQRLRLNKQLVELSNLIWKSEELTRSSVDLFKKGRLVPVGFNPVELNKKVYDLKIEKYAIEAEIQNLKGVEMVLKPYILKRPVSPKVKLNIFIAGLISLFVGIFIVFFMEYIGKIRIKYKT